MGLFCDDRFLLFRKDAYALVVLIASRRTWLTVRSIGTHDLDIRRGTVMRCAQRWRGLGTVSWLFHDLIGHGVATGGVAG